MLTDLFQAQQHLNSEEIDLLNSYWSEEVAYKRGEAVLQIGERERYLYYVLEGSQLLYFIDKSGNKIAVGFGYPGTIITGITSFLREDASTFGTDCLRKSKFLRISKERFYELREKIPAIDKSWQGFLEEALMGLIERETSMLIHDPRERLEILMGRSIHVFQHIPLKYIASYLRMTPETLSRIMKTI